MTIIKHSKLMLAGCVLSAGLLCLPSAPAKAGSRDAAIAAGIIGAVGTAIILQQHMNANKKAPQARRAARKPPAESSDDKAASNPKDPFAGTGAPAGYATPVSNKSGQ